MSLHTASITNKLLEIFLKNITISIIKQVFSVGVMGENLDAGNGRVKCNYNLRTANKQQQQKNSFAEY